MEEKELWRLKFNYMHMVLKVQALEEVMKDENPNMLKKWDELYDAKQMEQQDYLSELGKKGGVS